MQIEATSNFSVGVEGRKGGPGGRGKEGEGTTLSMMRGLGVSWVGRRGYLKDDAVVVLLGWVILREMFGHLVCGVFPLEGRKDCHMLNERRRCLKVLRVSTRCLTTLTTLCA